VTNSAALPLELVVIGFNMRPLHNAAANQISTQSGNARLSY